MIIDIYAANKKTDDGQNYAISVINHEDIYYTSIQSLGKEIQDEKNAQILALKNAVRMGLRLSLAGKQVVVFQTLDKVIDENGNIIQGNEKIKEDDFYCLMEHEILNDLLYSHDNATDIILQSVPKEKNIALIGLDDNDLGFYVDVEDIQIMEKGLAFDYTDAIFEKGSDKT